MIIEDQQREQVSTELEKMVFDFNQRFERWMEQTGCRANFSWKYAEKNAPKTLVIESIDAMVYRKPEPEWKRQMDQVPSLAESIPLPGRE